MLRSSKIFGSTFLNIEGGIFFHRLRTSWTQTSNTFFAKGLRDETERSSLRFLLQFAIRILVGPGAEYFEYFSYVLPLLGEFIIDAGRNLVVRLTGHEPKTFELLQSHGECLWLHMQDLLDLSKPPRRRLLKDVDEFQGVRFS